MHLTASTPQLVPVNVNRAVLDANAKSVDQQKPTLFQPGLEAESRGQHMMGATSQRTPWADRSSFVKSLALEVGTAPGRQRDLWHARSALASMLAKAKRADEGQHCNNSLKRVLSMSLPCFPSGVLAVIGRPRLSAPSASQGVFLSQGLERVSCMLQESLPLLRKASASFYIMHDVSSTSPAFRTRLPR